jgi:hypothetical protein
MKFKFFGYDPECGFELFETEEQAKQYAEDAIAEYRGESCDGWSEEVDQVCWGKLSQHTVMCNKKPSSNPEFSYYCDYKLKDVEQ